MRKAIRILYTLAFSSLLVGTMARGQIPSLWSVDENGPAIFNGPNFVGYANGTNRVDPISGIVGWYYPLGGGISNALVPGDVLLLEPAAGNTNSISDLLRFDGGGMFFFSDLEPGELNPDKADVPQMPVAINPLILGEIGPEGNNGVLYIPGPGQPGYDLSGYFPGMQYNIISDVPEPTVALLLFCGAAVLAGRTIRRRFRHK